MRLPSKDSALAKGIYTFFQALIGLAIAVWAMPGVQGVVYQHAVTYFGTVGVSTGVVAYIWNLIRTDVPNY